MPVAPPSAGLHIDEVIHDDVQCDVECLWVQSGFVFDTDGKAEVAQDCMVHLMGEDAPHDTTSP